MNRLLLLSCLLLIPVFVRAQTSTGYMPVNDEDFVWVSVKSGDWADPSTWEYRPAKEQRPVSAGPRTCFWPGCTENPGVLSPDQTVLIRSGHAVTISTGVTFGSFIKIARGGALYFININGNATGRLLMPYDYAQIYLEEGSDIQAFSDESATTSNDLNATQLQIGPSNNQINGGKINMITAPALLTSNNLKDCGNGQRCEPSFGTLPVEVLSMQVEAMGSKVNIGWSVAQENDLSHYAVEWSVDGQNFMEAGQVAALGTGSTAGQYSLKHAPEQQGFLYYRLLAVNIDGTAAEKALRTIDLGASAFRAYAAEGRVQVVYSGPDASRLTLFDMAGRVVASSPNTLNGIETVMLRSGVYILVLNNSLEQKSQRVIIR